MRPELVHTTAGLLIRGVTTVSWRELEPAHLLELLSGHLAYDLRLGLCGDAIAVLAEIPAVEGLEHRRAARLEEAVLDTAAALETAVRSGTRLPDRAARNQQSHSHTGWLEAVRWIAKGKGWSVAEADSGALRLLVTTEPDLPPLVVCPLGDFLSIERTVPILPERRASAITRWAVAHAVLQLNTELRFARLVLRDPAALTFAVESYIPVGDCDEPGGTHPGVSHPSAPDQADYALEGVRRGVRHAHGVLACVKHHAVAREYAAAQRLPVLDRGREQTTKEN